MRHATIFAHVALLASLGFGVSEAATTTTAAPVPAAGGQLSSGSIEFSPEVSFTHSNLKREGYGNVDTVTEFDFNPTLGFCVSNHFEVTGGALVRHVSANGMSDTNVGATTGLIYNFNRVGHVIPFAGAGFGVLFEEGFTFDNTAVIAPDLAAGVRMLVGNAASANVSLGYRHETDGHVHRNLLAAQVGVSLFPWHTK